MLLRNKNTGLHHDTLESQQKLNTAIKSNDARKSVSIPKLIILITLFNTILFSLEKNIGHGYTRV